MNTSHYSAGIPSGVESTDPELGNGDLRVFWIAALVAILAVSAVVFFKMNQPEWRPATVAQTSIAAPQAGSAGVQAAPSVDGGAAQSTVVRQ